MSTARGPKPPPPIAPKPKVTQELNGRASLLVGIQRGCTNEGSSIFDEKLDQDNNTENDVCKVAAEEVPVEQQFGSHILSSTGKELQNGSKERCEEEVTEEEKEEEEDMFQVMEEDWRLTDSALTEEVDSLETLWVSDAGFAADSEDAAEMIDTDMTQDMDADGCDAGEALADTDGLSVGDISVTSTDDEAAFYSGKKESKDLNERQEKLRIKEEETADCTGDDLTESLTDEPSLLINKNTFPQQVCSSDGEEKDEESGENLHCPVIDDQHICFYDITPENQKQLFDKAERCVALKFDLPPEPYYITSEDIIGRESIPRNEKAHGLSENPLVPQKHLSSNSSGAQVSKYEKSYDKDSPCGEVADDGQIECVSSEEYEEIGNNDEDVTDEKKLILYEERVSTKAEEHNAQTVEALLSLSDCQPRFRLVSVSVPTDTDTSLTSSLSESQLLSPLNDLDVFRDGEDLEGHIVPFLDDTTDTEQDVSDDHVYEEAGHSLEGDPHFVKKTAGTCSHSLSQHIADNVNEAGLQFNIQTSCLGGFGQRRPALSSSPMLNTVRHKSYSKPNCFSLYHRSLSMEGRDMPLCVYRGREQIQRERAEDGLSLHYGINSSGSFSRCSPLSSSGLSTPTSVVDIPPPFELAYITKRPITKSSPSLLTEGDSSEKNRKKKSSIKRFLMLKFRRKTESKPVVDVSPSFSRSSAESSYHTPSRMLDLDRHSVSSSPHLTSRLVCKPQVSPEPASAFLFYNDIKRKGNNVAFLNRSVVRVESFEDRSRVPFTPLPLTKPRSISFPNTDTSDYENVPAISSDYENIQVPQRRPIRQGAFTDFFDRPSRAVTSANETDGYVDMSSLPGFESKTQSPEEETERYAKSVCDCTSVCSCVFM